MTAQKLESLGKTLLELEDISEFQAWLKTFNN
ncbi:hypothetical protein RIF25_10600 [Thermosynechococcaceae cyanobacterium BACA0444]|uniref:Uncharacterized protein n=1 Tax=Pseudocalidococcus azoricus BACA0444 TaxID=2918990 RepID=A0AAE4FSE6_9CYAN|nr:hypothetical protein [Pseudocalidococcus azoricus]MDS3861256.1 hypothetical protein [Pseudocalidococcus azoricus BACA0444]